ncbi:mitochondrial carrier domain-containing protein [Umbelopsis sp. PMI_123]|nr:mitochondrial carrier domain-containing protein [Umbelopsis sp. PMI_123]
MRKQLDDLMFGSIAGIVGKFVEYPFDTVKVRLQTQSLTNPKYAGPLDCIIQTVKQHGIKDLYRGLSSPLVGSMIENAALFVGYKQVQRIIRDVSATPEQRQQYTELSDPDESLKQLSLSQLILAGTISGAFTSIVLTPVELIKCKLQVQQHGAHGSINFRGPLHIITHTFQQNGLAGFYRGHLATFIRECGGGAFWFGSYEYVCMLFMRYREKKTGQPVYKDSLSPQELMAAGAIGGMAYNFSFFPFDVVKSHMQTEEELTGVKRRFGQVVKSVWEGAGIRGFYQGCGITVARSAPTSAIIFMTYELLSRHFG